MSVRTRNGDGEFATVGPDVPDLESFDAILLENEDVLIYDGDAEDAWIQSDDYVDLGVTM